ncbi:MAG: hypothetical protein WDN75_00770 [Bacteroidota bacterium]
METSIFTPISIGAKRNHSSKTYNTSKENSLGGYKTILPVSVEIEKYIKEEFSKLRKATA